MADETRAEVAAEKIDEKIADVSEKIEQTREDVQSGDVAGAEARLRQLEDRLAALEAASTDLRQGIDGRAPADHTHPLPGHLQTISDALAELEAEERAPNRQSWVHRKLWGGS
jgi:septation ring formation regulator EzrA